MHMCINAKIIKKFCVNHFGLKCIWASPLIDFFKDWPNKKDGEDKVESESNATKRDGEDKMESGIKRRKNEKGDWTQSSIGARARGFERRVAKQEAFWSCLE